MPPARKTPTAASKLPPSRRSSSFADVHVAIERVTPDVLALLQDGVPRSKATIIAALPTDMKEDIKRTLMRLAGHSRRAHGPDPSPRPGQPRLSPANHASVVALLPFWGPAPAGDM
jgi:hypothetical protein